MGISQRQLGGPRRQLGELRQLGAAEEAGRASGVARRPFGDWRRGQVQNENKRKKVSLCGGTIGDHPL